MKIAKAIRKVYYRVCGAYPTNIQGMNFKVDPYHIDYWRKVKKGRWEPHTFKVLSKFLKPDSVYVDIGAWIGPTVIYAARKCGQVFCFEPDPFAYRYLCWNIELNGFRNITPFNIAFSDSFSIQRMASFGEGLGDSMTSLLADDQDHNGIDVLTMTWKEFIRISEAKRIDFIKMDIEGSEFTLLPTMKEYLSQNKPILYLSLHPQFVQTSLRDKKMQQIFEVFSIYRECLDQNLEPTTISSLDHSRTVDRNYSYILMD